MFTHPTLTTDPSVRQSFAADASGIEMLPDAVARPTEHGPHQTTDLEPEGDYDVIARDFCDLADRVVLK